MKRFLLISLGVLVSGVLGLQLGQMSFAVSTSEELLSNIFQDSDLSEGDTKDPKELNNLASNEEAPFENLYLFMFQNVTRGPSDAALDQIQSRLKEKKRRDYNTDELRSIVVEGSLEPIIEKWESVTAEIASDPTYFDEQDERIAAQDEEYSSFQEANEFDASISGFYDWYYEEYVQGDALTEADVVASVPQQDILDEYNYLVGLYQNELELQREYRKFAYEAVADEMFFNNDLGDSANIDILNDLDQAHYILFGSVIDYPDRSAGEDVSLASDESFDLDLPMEEEVAPPEELAPVQADPVVTLSSDVVSPYTCLDDEALRTALDKFYASDADEVAQLDLPESTIVYPSTDDDSNPGEDDEEGSEDPDTETPQEEVDRALQSLDGFINELQGTKGDWTRSLPCSEVFCITVELVGDTEDPVVENNYGATSNCVLCHLAYINKRMGETLDKSLVAAKPSQNWFEDSTCKEAGSGINLDLNVYTIAVPIDLDPGDEIDDAASKRIDELTDTLESLGALPTETSQLNKTKSDVECESLINLYDVSGSEVSIDQAQEACTTAATNLQLKVDEAIYKLKFEAAVGDGNTLYEQAAGELYSMLLIFRNIQDGLKKTYLIEDAPLSVLMGKDYCK